jgi:predicted aspartyl protease
MKRYCSLLLAIILISLNTFPIKAQIEENREYSFLIDGNSKKTVIPFELHHNLIIIPVKLQGKLPLKFIVDTGVQYTILLEKNFSDLLNINYNREFELIGTGGERLTKAYVANNIQLKLTGATAKGLQMLVMERNFMNEDKFIDTEVHGIIGAELFKNFVVKIDYDQKRLTLYNPSRYRKGWWYKELPLELIKSKPYLKVGLILEQDTIPDAKLLIDTGASHALLLDTASHAKYRIPEKNLPDVLGWSISGPIKGHIARTNGLMIGEYEFDKVVTSFPNKAEYLQYIEKIDRQGTLGGELLKRFKVVIDYPEEKLYLRRGLTYRNEFPYDMSGLTVVKADTLPDALKVFEVRENSPAHQAGLETGDLILSANSYSGKNLTLKKFTNLMHSRDNRKIRLKIKRKNSMQIKKFRLKKIL